MTITRLQDDLIKDFNEQKKSINEQIELFEPLATSLRKPAAHRLMNQTVVFSTELLCYLLCLATIAFTVLMDRIYPFTVLLDGSFGSHVDDVLHLNEKQAFNVAVHSLGGIIAFLFFVLARATGRIRQKNAVLNLAGKNIKQLVGQHLKRKAAIENLEQRHFPDLPPLDAPQKVTDIPNPGY